MPRQGERTAAEYRAEADRMRAEAGGVAHQLIRNELIDIAMRYEALARIAEMLERVRG